MFIELSLSVAVGAASAAVFAWVFSTEIRSRLYSLECDLADLQERHLRSVRKASILSRWDKEADVDEKISALVPQRETLKTKGWTKWASKSQNSSDVSPQE